MSLVKDLIELLGVENVLLDDDLSERYFHIWEMDKPLQAMALVLPRSVVDVSGIMKLCHRYRTPVVVHGGLTNLVGSTETNGNELVISMEKLNQIEEVDSAGRTMAVQAGVLLEEIQNTAAQKDLLFPLNFGAKGSAQIGGIISTNAGGLRVFRFGMTRDLILGLEVVLADGTIISSMKKLIKDNSGYDLKQLFIGAEGTLGIITRAILKLKEAPKSRVSALIGLDTFEKVLKLLKKLDAGMAGTLSAFELIWPETYDAMTGPYANYGPPIPTGYPYYVLTEVLGSDQEGDRKRLESLLADSIDHDQILDAAFAETAADLKWFWTLREDVGVFVSHLNNEQHFDISLPIPLIGEIVKKIKSHLSQLDVVEHVHCFGHMADGNIHFIIGKSSGSKEAIDAVNHAVYKELGAIGGSVSAEHGIGVHKKQFLNISKTQEEVNLMRTIKKALDPFALFNPGKIF